MKKLLQYRYNILLSIHGSTGGIGTIGAGVGTGTGTGTGEGTGTGTGAGTGQDSHRKYRIGCEI